MKRVLVTGGAGFIGSHLVEELISQGYHVTVLDDLSQGRREWIHKKANFFQGSLADKELCIKLCKQVDGVMHLAAMSRVAASLSEGPFGKDAIEKIEFCTDQNIIGTQNLLTAAALAGNKRFVYTSSSAIYGDGPSPNRVGNPERCLNPYSYSKFVGEAMCGLFARHFGLSTVSLRLFNVYGLRQPRTGPYALVLGIFLERLVHNQTLIIHGTGEQARDFIHVDDIVSAFIAAYNSDVLDKVLNVGMGETHSVKELADLISKDQKQEARRPGDAEVTLADIEDTKRLLKWRPKVSFKEGITALKDAALKGEF